MTKRVEVHSRVRKISLALNYVYDDKTKQKRALPNRQIALSQRAKVSVVQDRTVGNHEKRSPEAWQWGFLKHCGST